MKMAKNEGILSRDYVTFVTLYYFSVIISVMELCSIDLTSDCFSLLMILICQTDILKEKGKNNT
jgi:hypothetical protein